MRRLPFFIWSVVLAVCLSPAWAAAQDAAMVVDLAGQVVWDSGPKAGGPVMLMDFLVKGDRLKLDSGATLTLNYFASGRREKVAGPGTVTADLNGGLAGGAARVTGEQAAYIPPSKVASAKDSQHMGMVAFRDVDLSGKKKVRLLTLDQTAARSTQLRFQWLPTPGAEKYKIVLRDAQGKVVDEATTTKTEINYQSPDLTRGPEFTWTVQAIVGGQATAEGSGRFFLLTLPVLSQLSFTEQYILRHYPGDSTEAKIALAMVFKKYQLNDEARTILEDLKKQNPNNPNIARQLGSLQANYKPGP